MTNAPENQRKVLGKGLSALLPGRESKKAAVPPATKPAGFPSPLHIRTDHIDPNPQQPRTVFEPQKLDELAISIAANGVIQPLILRRKGDRFELIAGERRLRAAKKAGLWEVPAVIQDYADNRLLEIALVENLQREDLNPIETAQALARLAKELNLTHDEISIRTGKDRTTVTNLIRLLKLPNQVQVLLAEHRLSMGHARALLGLNTAEQQVELGERCAAQGYSVRQVEREVRLAVREPPIPSAPTAARVPDPNVAAAVRDLEGALGTKVRIVERSGQKGRIEIDYYSQDDLNRLYDLLMAIPR